MGKRLSSAGNVVCPWHSWHIALIAVSLCAGCGGSVVTGNASSGGAGGSGASNGVGTPGSGGSAGGGFPGSGGAPLGNGSGGGPSGGSSGFQEGGIGGGQNVGSSCKETNDHTGVQIDAFGGQSYGCFYGGPLDGGAPAQPKWSTTGIVTKTSPNTIVVDSCPPDADCIPMLSSISVHANGLALSIPIGRIVSVDYLGPSPIQQTFAPCSNQLIIQSVGDWGGAHDPMGDGYLYVAAVDGSYTAPTGMPFKVALAKIACSTYKQGLGGGPVPAGDYALRFYSTPSYTNVTVPMGSTDFLVTKPQKLHVHNLRSYQDGGTDSYWNWAYWVAP